MPQGEKYFLAVFASCCLGKPAGTQPQLIWQIQSTLSISI